MPEKWIQQPHIYHEASASTYLLLSHLYQELACALHDSCTRRPRYNIAPHAHQTSLAAAPPARGAPHGRIGHPRARRFLLERPLLPSTKASGIPRSGDESPRDALVGSRVFVSYKCFASRLLRLQNVFSQNISLHDVFLLYQTIRRVRDKGDHNIITSQGEG